MSRVPHAIYLSNEVMTERHGADLGDVQQTLFITLAGRARETRKKHPLLEDPMAVRIIESVDFDEKIYGADWGDWITVLRTMVFDSWVRGFLDEHPHGTVVELGSGLNTRFERVDNDTVRWFDIDMPDTVALRSRFFTDTQRRTTIAASALDTDWYDTVEQTGGPYFFVAEGVLVYLPEAQVRAMLSRIATRFPGALIAFDSYRVSMMQRQHKAAERKSMPARWAWACDDPRTFTEQGLTVVESRTMSNAPETTGARLPVAHRMMLWLLGRGMHGGGDLTLFRAGSPTPAA